MNIPARVMYEEGACLNVSRLAVTHSDTCCTVFNSSLPRVSTGVFFSVSVGSKTYDILFFHTYQNVVPVYKRALVYFPF